MRGRIPFALLAPLLLLLLASSGCLHHRLQRATVNQAGTIHEIQYQQVLNNLALIAAQPQALPEFAVLGAGTVSVQESVSGQGNLSFLRSGFSSWGIGGSTGRSNLGNWTVAVMNDPDKLELMRCVYHHVLGLRGADPCVDCEERLRDFFGDDFALCSAPSLWLGIGQRRDVPHDACYVGRYGSTFVWVLPGGMHELTRVTLSILDIATYVPRPPRPAATRQVTEYHYDVHGRLVRQETREEPITELRRDPFAPPELLPSPEPAPERLRRDFYDPYRGLFFQ